LKTIEKLKVFVKTLRFWALALVVPLTLLLFPVIWASLFAPVLLYWGFSIGTLVVAGVQFVFGLSLASALVLSWVWIVTGCVPRVHERRRRRFFFSLFGIADLVLCYYAYLQFTAAWWAGLLLLAGAGALSFALWKLARADRGPENV